MGQERHSLTNVREVENPPRRERQAGRPRLSSYKGNCSVCGVDVEIGKTGRGYYCRAASAQATANKLTRRIAVVLALKLDRASCAHQGPRCLDRVTSVKEHPELYQFDHIPGRGRKLFEIGQWATSGTGKAGAPGRKPGAKNGTMDLGPLKREAAKCELVCLTDHIERTSARMSEARLAAEGDVAVPRKVLEVPGRPPEEG